MDNRGQFSIIATLLVAVVLVGTLIAVYSTIRYDSSQNQSPQVLTATDETDSAILKALGFTVGYYGSILQVTGNSTYARANATAYMNSALQYISSMNPSWGTSLHMTSLKLSTNWFTNSSISTGQISVLYDLAGLGISGINYTGSCSLGVQIFNSPSSNQVCLNVTQDGTSPLLTLGAQNFGFYSYVYSNMTWKQVYPSSTLTVFTNGTYLINVPNGVDPSAYVLQVTDSRGLMVQASSFNSYEFNFATVGSLQSSPVTIELLQNGTMRWLGQNLQNSTLIRPIPPIPVKAFHLSPIGTTFDLPYQIEDWASQYQIPLGLTSNYTVFSNNQMIVFQVSAALPQVTLWWNGSDSAIQPSSAIANTHFTDNPNAAPNYGTLSNGYLSLRIVNQTSPGNGAFYVISSNGTVTSTSNFMRIDKDNSTYGSSAAYVVYNGIVRDIIQQEAEWSNGAKDPNNSTNYCPNIYSQIVLTLPANVNYFTYQLRLLFVPSLNISRVITDINPIQLTTSMSNPIAMTENGVIDGIPNVSNGSGTFTNSGFPNGPVTPHHWSELINSGLQGAGLMFTDIPANQSQLYTFDSIAGKATGAIYANQSIPTIELDPVTPQGPVVFNSTLNQESLSYTWTGAVSTFNGASPIYSNGSGGPTGLWQLVEQPPVITETPANANGASIALSPNTGPVGTSVAVSGSGFFPNSNVTITYDGTNIATTVANASGFIPSGVMFNIPASVAGSSHTVTATDAFANSASASFTVGPLISLNPAAGNVGSTITVTGSGFAANSTITLSFDGLIQTTSPTTIVSSNTGGFTATFTVPLSAPGIHIVQATDGTNSFAVIFNVTSSISLNPQTGLIGSTVSVSGSNFAANSSITIKFDGTNQSTSPAVIRTGSNGSFSATFVVPASAIGNHTVTSIDASSNSASATFTVTSPSITLVPTSGLQNSSVTVSGSNFLPNSTVTLTFAGTPVSTTPYPIIVSGAGSFSASFTVPSGSLGGKTVTATDASSNSASATYTITSPAVSLNPSSGFVGTTVTVSGSNFLPNSALTITYDGTIVATATSTGSGAVPSGVTFTVPASVFGSHTVRVVDVGGNAATATFSVVASINFTPATGPVGTSITISGQGFAANSTITVKFNGATVTTSPTTVTTDYTGSFSSVTFTVPSSSSGSKPIQVTDAASNAASGTFTVTSSITLNPTNGGIGTTVTITGKGLAASSTITIKYDGNIQATSPSSVTSDANGSFSCSFTVPTSTAGAHTVLATDGTNSPTATFTVNTVLQPITVTMSNSAPSATVTVNGGNPSPSTFAADGTSHSINMTAGASFNLSFSNAGNTRCGFAVSGSFSSTSNSYVASGTPVAVTAYEQVQNTFSVTLSGGNPSSGDTLNLTGTLLGSPANILSLNVGGQSSASSLAWTDYNTIVTFPSATTMSNSTQRWAINGLYSTTALTTGGNTYSKTYYHQYQMTLSYSVSGGGSGYSAPSFSANAFGVSSPQTLTATATGYWFDAGSSWSLTNALTGSSPSERWQTSQSTSGTVSATTIAFAYYHQYLMTLSYSVSGGGSPTAPTFNANQYGASAPQALTTTPTGYWFDAGSSWNVTNPLGGSGASERWQTSQSTSGTVSAMTIAFAYYHQYQLTMATNFGTTTPAVGSAWYNASAAVTISATAPNAGNGEQYVWNGWTGSGTGSYTGTSNSTTVTMNGPVNETASWTHQYYLTVSSPYGTTSGQGWYSSGATAYAVLNTGTALGGTGTQYVFSSWSGDASGTNYAQSNGIMMNAPKTATTSWQTQYYLTVSSSYGSPTGQGWYNAGSSASFAVTTPASGGTGTQYVFTSWSGSGSGSYSGASSSQSVTMNNPINETASWQTQYYLTVSSSYGSPTGQGWYNAGSSPSFAVTTPASGGTGTQYVFTSWSGSGSGSYSGASSSQSVTMNNPINETASWKTQYQVTFDATSNVKGDSSATILKINGSSVTLPYTTGWLNSGVDSVTYAFQSPIASSGSPSNTQYVWSSTSGLSQSLQSNTFTVTATGTVTGTYNTQYKVTFDASSNVKSDSSAIIVTVAGTGHNYAQLPYANWYNSSSSLSYTYASAVASSSSPTTKGYVWSSTSGLSQTLRSNTFTVSASGTITATYNTQTFGIDTNCIGFGAESSSGSSPVTTSSMTAQANELIIVVVTSGHSGSSSIRSFTVTDSFGDTYTQRGTTVSSGSNAEQISEYYANTGSHTGSFTVTATDSSGSYNRNIDVLAFGIMGAAASPFDTHAGLPYSGSSTSSGVPTVTGVSTSNANDMVLAFEGHSSSTADTVGTLAGTAFSAPSGFLNNANSEGCNAEYQIVSSTLSSATATFGTSESNWVMIVDAVQRAW